MIVRELLTKLGFTTDEGKVQSYLNSISSVKTATIALTAVTTVAAAAAFKLVKELADRGDELLRLSDITGQSVEDLQALELYAKRNSVAFSDMTTGLRFLNKNIAEGRRGGKAQIEDFASIGITLADLKNKNPQQIFEMVAEAVSKVEDPAERVRIAMSLLGRAGANLIPALKKGSAELRLAKKEYKELFFTIDKGTADAADAVGDSIDDLLGGVKSLKYEIARELLPMVRDIVNAVTAWWKANKEVVAARIIAGVRLLRDVLQLLWYGIIVWGGLALYRLIAAKAVLVLLSSGSIIAGLRVLGATLLGVFASPVVAIAALILIIQDLYTWITGGESVIGGLFGSWEDLNVKIGDAIGGMIESVKIWLQILKDDFIKTWDDIVQYVSEKIEAIANFFGLGVGSFNVAAGNVRAGNSAAQAAPSAAAVGASNNTSQSYVLKPVFNIATPAGTSREQIDTISNTITAELTRMMQQVSAAHPQMERGQ